MSAPASGRGAGQSCARMPHDGAPPATSASCAALAARVPHVLRSAAHCPSSSQTAAQKHAEHDAARGRACHAAEPAGRGAAPCAWPRSATGGPARGASGCPRTSRWWLRTAAGRRSGTCALPQRYGLYGRVTRVIRVSGRAVSALCRSARTPERRDALRMRRSRSRPPLRAPARRRLRQPRWLHTRCCCKA